MIRYISEDKVKDAIVNVLEHREDVPDDAIDEVLKDIGEIPTEDVVPVRHGHWVIERGVSTPGGDPCYVCSECGGTPHLCGIESGNKIHPKYCQDCGAKMDGDTE